MRKLFAFNMVTLDGYFEGPNQDITWHNADNDEFGEFAQEQLGTIGTILFGRVTYQLMASYWPTATADDPIVANLMNAVPKVVFSRTLDKAEWNNTRLVKDHVAEEIAKMKQQPGKEIALFGSANLQSTLMQMDLIDEHRIMVNPVLLGSGTPLFKDLGRRYNLTLVDTRTFRSGNVMLHYHPAR